MKKKLQILLSITVCLTLTFLLSIVLAENSIVTSASVEKIKSYGNIILDLTREEMETAGMNLGDLVIISFDNQSVEMPYCTNYTDVDTGKPVLVWRNDHDDHAIAIADGSFAETYGVAEKTEEGWLREDGDTFRISLTLKEAGAYYDEYLVRSSLIYTDEREDYPQLTDAEFANFREVSATGMVPGRLFRSSSPLKDSHNRAASAASAIQSAGIQVILNLSDDEKTMQAWELYPNSYYAEQNVIALDMGMNIADPKNMSKLAEGLRFVLDHEGPICVHCEEGKDRSGYVCAVLERLVGVSYEEILEDYMVSFSNYYRVTRESELYPVLTARFEKIMINIMGENLDAADYLLRCGLTEEEVNALILRLTQ